MEKDALRLQNHRLRADIAPPGRRYDLTRFDWTGNVAQVLLDGRHTFLGQEQPAGSPAMGGFGLQNEFRIEGPGSFEDTPAGEWCIKIGIGLVRKPDDKPYNFRQRYECRPFDVQVSQPSDDCAVYRSLLADARGFSLLYEKTVRIEDSTLTLEHRVENRGKPIRFREFSHNFLLLDNHPIGPDYRLMFSSLPPLTGEQPDFTVSGDTIAWDRTPGDYFLVSGEIDAPPDTSRWRLDCAANGLAVTCDMDFPPVRLTLYGRADVVCPEVYTGQHLEEGETAVWSRRYTFTDGD